MKAPNPPPYKAIGGFLPWTKDTQVAPDMVDSLTEAFRWYSFPERVAVIGSNYRDKATGKILDEGSCRMASPAREMVAVLTSGSLVSVDALRAVGGFRDEFFIDCVDFEYCLRARSTGFHVLVTCKPVMEHGIGHPSGHRLLWKTFGTSNHSPLRQVSLGAEQSNSCARVLTQRTAMDS